MYYDYRQILNNIYTILQQILGVLNNIFDKLSSFYTDFSKIDFSGNLSLLIYCIQFLLILKIIQTFGCIYRGK